MSMSGLRTEQKSIWEMTNTEMEMEKEKEEKKKARDCKNEILGHGCWRALKWPWALVDRTVFLRRRISSVAALRATCWWELGFLIKSFIEFVTLGDLI